MGLWNDKSLIKTGKVFGLHVQKIIIEKMSRYGYDFERHYTANKDAVYSDNMPLKRIFDKMYFKYLYYTHKFHFGQNIVCIYEK